METAVGGRRAMSEAQCRPVRIAARAADDVEAGLLHIFVEDSRRDRNGVNERADGYWMREPLGAVVELSFFPVRVPDRQNAERASCES